MAKKKVAKKGLTLDGVKAAILADLKNCYKRNMKQLDSDFVGDEKTLAKAKSGVSLLVHDFNMDLTDKSYDMIYKLEDQEIAAKQKGDSK